jgi:hypothetical protein
VLRGRAPCTPPLYGGLGQGLRALRGAAARPKWLNGCLRSFGTESATRVGPWPASSSTFSCAAQLQMPHRHSDRRQKARKMQVIAASAMEMAGLTPLTGSQMAGLAPAPFLGPLAYGARPGNLQRGLKSSRTPTMPLSCVVHNHALHGWLRVWRSRRLRSDEKELAAQALAPCVPIVG